MWQSLIGTTNGLRLMSSTKNNHRPLAEQASEKIAFTELETRLIRGTR